MQTQEEKEIHFYESCYNQEQVENLLKENNIPLEKFNKWIYGQTGLILEKDGKNIFGYFKSDVDTFIRYAKQGKQAPVWD